MPDEITIQQEAPDADNVQQFGVMHGDVHIHTAPPAEPAPDKDFIPIRNPYKALNAFTPDGVEDFCGREAVTDELGQALIPDTHASSPTEEQA